MRKPKNFDKIDFTSIWFYAPTIGKQVELVVTPADYKREGMGEDDSSALWMMEANDGHIYWTTHRILIEIWWPQEQLHLHIVKIDNGTDGIIVNSRPLRKEHIASYTQFTKVLQYFGERWEHKLGGK
jgi:hypothetical protein